MKKKLLFAIVGLGLVGEALAFKTRTPQWLYCTDSLTKRAYLPYLYKVQ